MATRHRVSCITKKQHHNPHERIQGIGGLNPDQSRWWLPEDRAIADIQNQIYSFFVSVGGRDADVIVAEHLGRKYLKTTVDGYEPNNLLSLPDCPT